MRFFEELKRRNVFRVGIGYVITAWLLLQVADVVLNNIAAPGWVFKVVMLVLALGFPLALFFAWAFEVTPEGIKKEKDVDRDRSITPQTGRKLDRSIIVVLLIGLAWFAWDKFEGDSGPISSPTLQTGASRTTGKLGPVPVSAKSIAVLPFADLSQAKDQEWFADGLAEEILNALAKTPDLLVSSRTSSFRFKDSTLDLPDIAQALGVAHILEGSVRRSGKRIRVTAQLIRASDGFHIWSENYDRDIADMISIQEDLAVNIAKALKTTMDPAALAAMMNAGTRSIEAYETYLRGQTARSQSISSGENEFYQKAYQDYEQARSIDPNFAAAHVRAADYWKVQLTPSRTASGLTELEPRQMLDEFNQRIDRAIATAKTAADKKGYQAYKATVELRWHEAIHLYQAYLEERPNDEDARYELFSLAALVSDSGLQKEILAYWHERGATDQNAAFSYMNDAYQVLDPSAAADFGLQALQRWPDNRSLLYQTHRTLMWAGRILEGKQLADRYSRLGDNSPILQARQACAEGRRTDAEAIYDTIDPNDIYGRSERWHILKLLGRERDAADVLQRYADSGVPFQIAGYLQYQQFDPTPFPAVMAVLKREGVNRPAPVDIPFKCPPPEQTSIAVLPFVNMSNDTDNEFFSDGISEEILNVLARIPDLKVAARTSAFTYKGSNTKIAQIAQELGVNHILEGSVRKAGNQVRVTAQLIKADDGFHLWSGNYDRELTNIFAIQDEIAGSIADALKVSLKLESGATGNLTGTNSIAAYEHYLQGMSLWHERTGSSLRSALKAFEAATGLDPQFAKGWAGQALTWGVIDGYTPMDISDTGPKAMEAANRALSLAPDNVESVAALGIVARLQFRFAQATGYFKQAMALNPSYASAYQWYGSTLGVMGDPEAGLAMYQKAWQLDPRSRVIGINLALRLSGLERGEEAEQVTQAVLEFAPEFPDGLDMMFLLKLFAGDCAAAKPYGDQLAKLLNKTVNSTNVYMDLCQRNDPAARAAAVTTIVGWSNIEFADPAHPALSYATDLVDLMTHLGELDAAWQLIDQYGQTKEGLAWLRNNRTINGIRLQCDPRVREAVRRTGLPPAVKPVKCR